VALAACGHGAATKTATATSTGPEPHASTGDEVLAGVSFDGADTVIPGPDDKTVVTVGHRDDGLCVILAWPDGTTNSLCGSTANTRLATVTYVPTGQTVYFAGFTAPDIDSLSLTGLDLKVVLTPVAGLTGAQAFIGSVAVAASTPPVDTELVGSSKGQVRFRKPLILKPSVAPPDE
jgi:hypothetical protein